MSKRKIVRAESTGAKPKRVRGKAPAAVAGEDKPIWEVFEEISKSVPPEAWKSVPRDLSKRVDYYLYGKGQSRLLGRRNQRG